jgi:hypothetical protein
VPPPRTARLRAVGNVVSVTLCELWLRRAWSLFRHSLPQVRPPWVVRQGRRACHRRRLFYPVWLTTKPWEWWWRPV